MDFLKSVLETIFVVGNIFIALLFFIVLVSVTSAFLYLFITGITGDGMDKEGENWEKISLCEMCGEPMPKGEEMFKYHGYSGPCPKPPLRNEKKYTLTDEQVALAKSHIQNYENGNHSGLLEETAELLMEIMNNNE